MKLRIALSLALTLLALVALPLARASAAVLPGQALDGPSADIVGFGDLDVAPDGTGALAYIKKAGGVDHIFVSRLVNGGWVAPERVDIGDVLASSLPRVAAGNNGRFVVTYLNGDGGVNVKLRGVLRPSLGEGYGAPVSILNQGGEPVRTHDVDMNPAGVAYSIYSVINGGGNMHASRLEGAAWTKVGGAYPAGELNNNLALSGPEDGMPQNTPRVAVDGTGNAVAAWPENNSQKVFARRLNGTTLGTVAEVSVDSLGGAPTANNSTMINMDTGASSSPWIVMRQQFTYGATNKARTIARQLIEGSFGGPQVLDGLPEPPADQVAEFPDIDIAEGGAGLAASRYQPNNQMFGSALSNGAWTAGFRVDSLPNAAAQTPSVAVGDTGDGLFAWHQDSGGAKVVRALYRTAGVNGNEVDLSNPAFGPAEDVTNLESAASAAGQVAVGFSQGAAGARRIIGAVVDRPNTELSIVKTASTPAPKVGANFTYTLAVRNNSAIAATNVTVNDTLPAGLTLVTAAPSPGTCTGTTAITCAVGALAGGATANITLTVRATRAGAIVNTASVTSPTPDGNVANNSSSASVAAVPNTLSLTAVSLSPRTFRIGSLLPRLKAVRRIPTGSEIRYRLGRAATALMTFQRRQTGRRVGRTCRALTRGNRNRPKCIRYVTKGTLSLRSKAGANRVRFQGRLTRTRTLPTGSYRMLIRATDANLVRSVRKTTTFTLVARLRR